MNEEQRLANQHVNQPKHKDKPEKDYSKYFETVFTAPSLKDAKKRGKEEIKYHKDFKIAQEFAGMGVERTFYIRTYGWP